MFGNKKCSRCDKTIKKDFEFCPYCGTNFKNPLQEREDYGLLGKNDNVSELGKMFNGIMQPGILDKMVSSLMKNLEKEINMQENPSPIPKTNTNFELFINGKKIPINQSSIQIGTKNPEVEKQQPIKIDEESIKKSIDD